jgi:UPF0716 protein FxsA
LALILLILFIGVPILEIAVFIRAGELIGLWPTIGVVVLTAIAGSALLRYQGFATLARARETLARDELPVREMFDGLCLLAAGILLLTPGFVTDALGFLLFLPPVRLVLRYWIVRRVLASGEIHFRGHTINPRGTAEEYRSESIIIEGEFSEVEERRRRPQADREEPPEQKPPRPPTANS